MRVALRTALNSSLGSSPSSRHFSSTLLVETELELADVLLQIGQAGLGGQ
jgi:hypothetical protein